MTVITIPIPPYRWELLGPYNGFSGLERARGHQLTAWAVRAGLLPTPDRCSICEVASERRHYHSENYYDPLHAYPICSKCHMALHRRFRSPDRWLALVERHGRAGAWFSQLSLEPVDLAAELRRADREAIADILATLLRLLPPGAPRPSGRLVETWDFAAPAESRGSRPLPFRLGRPQLRPSESNDPSGCR